MALADKEVPEADTAVSESVFSRYKWRMLLAAMFCYLFFLHRPAGIRIRHPRHRS